MKQEEILEEVWDKYHQQIGSTLDDLQYFEGRNVITREDFYKAASSAMDAQTIAGIELAKDRLFMMALADGDEVFAQRIQELHTAAILSELKNDIKEG